MTNLPSGLPPEGDGPSPRPQIPASNAPCPTADESVSLLERLGGLQDRAVEQPARKSPSDDTGSPGSNPVGVPSSLHPLGVPAEASTSYECGRGSRPPEGDRSFPPPARFPGHDPKTTPGSSGQADAGAPRRPEDRGEYQHHTEVDGPPPRRRFDSFTAANFPRTGRNRSAFRRHTANSSCRTRGQRPQAIELTQHNLQLEPKLEPEGPGTGCPRDYRFPREAMVGRTLERPGSSSRASTPASFRLRRFSRP